MRRYRTTGEKEAKPRGATVAPTIDEAALKLMQRWVEQKPDSLLQDLCEKLAAQQGIPMSQPTMYRAVQRLRMSRKKTLYANEQDTPRICQQRDDYRCWLAGASGCAKLGVYRRSRHSCRDGAFVCSSIPTGAGSGCGSTESRYQYLTD
jgi:hypothetical protein